MRIPIFHQREPVLRRIEINHLSAQRDLGKLGRLHVIRFAQRDIFLALFHNGLIALVEYGDTKGFVKAEYLGNQTARATPFAITEEERHNVNLFLTNFTETGMNRYDAASTTDAELVRFAVRIPIFHQREPVLRRIEINHLSAQRDSGKLGRLHVIRFAQRDIFLALFHNGLIADAHGFRQRRRGCGQHRRRQQSSYPPFHIRFLPAILFNCL